MTEKIRIILVDDHTVFRRGLKALLTEIPEFIVVADYDNPITALESYKIDMADLILLDVNMPSIGGVEMIDRLRSLDKNIKIIMLTVSQNNEDLFGAIQKGVNGYLIKNIDPEKLKDYIQSVALGNSILSPEVTQKVINAVRLPLNSVMNILSEREVEILNCLSNDLKNPQISEKLFISENTVKTHLRHIFKKLEAKNRTEAVAKGKSMGFI